MARHRSHSVEFKRQVAQEFVTGETLHGLAKRHDISRNLIRVWVAKFEAGAFDEDAQAADLIQEYEARIAALERMVGRQALASGPGYGPFDSAVNDADSDDCGQRFRSKPDADSDPRRTGGSDDPVQGRRRRGIWSQLTASASSMSALAARLRRDSPFSSRRWAL